MLLMLLMKAKKLIISFSIIILTTRIPILTLSATAAIPDKDDDEWPCCSVHTFAAAATTAVVEVTIGYSAQSRTRMH